MNTTKIHCDSVLLTGLWVGIIFVIILIESYSVFLLVERGHLCIRNEMRARLVVVAIVHKVLLAYSWLPDLIFNMTLALSGTIFYIRSRGRLFYRLYGS